MFTSTVLFFLYIYSFPENLCSKMLKGPHWDMKGVTAVFLCLSTTLLYVIVWLTRCLTLQASTGNGAISILKTTIRYLSCYNMILMRRNLFYIWQYHWICFMQYNTIWFNSLWLMWQICSELGGKAIINLWMNFYTPPCGMLFNILFNCRCKVCLHLFPKNKTL